MKQRVRVRVRVRVSVRKRLEAEDTQARSPWKGLGFRTVLWSRLGLKLELGAGAAFRLGGRDTKVVVEDL